MIPVTPTTPLKPFPDAARIDAYLSHLAETGVLSGSVLVAQDGMLFSKGYGLIFHAHHQVQEAVYCIQTWGYGYGWFIAAEPQGKLIYHEGHIDGYFTYNGFYPESHLVVVVLSNLETTDVLKIRRMLASFINR